MPSNTPNINLNRPDFELKPWHDEVNDNFTAIDAVFKSTFGIEGLLGAYQNSTAVVTGDRYYDENTGFYYEAQSDFTTLASPNTFADERTAHPTRWQLLDASQAIEAAGNAAASETAAAASAAAAAASETAASASQTAAASSASDASNAATAASASASAVSTAATAASNAATAAAASETAAASSASNASTSASAAAASASAANTSETVATASEIAAATSASNASSSATAAASSASSASGSDSSASSAATTAISARDAALEAAKFRYNTIADMEASGITYTASQAETVVAGDYIEAEGYRFQVQSIVITDEHYNINGVKIYAAPDASGWCFAKQFGVVYDSRIDAAANGAAINVAFAFCGIHHYGFDFGVGTFFNSVPLLQEYNLLWRAGGAGYWQKQYTSSFETGAKSVMSMTGTGSKDQTLFGVSSCQSWGASRVNPSTVANYNDSNYHLDSYVNENASATTRSLKNVSVAWTIKGANNDNRNTWSTYGSGLLITVDHGGDDGLQEVKSSNRDVDKALSSGDWDIGMMVRSTRSHQMHNVNIVGQWRMRAFLFAPHAKITDTGAAGYKCAYHKCTFSSIAIRGIDSAPITSTTTTTVTIPWADDHPFGADGDLTLQLSTQGRSGDSFTYTTMTKLTDDIDTGKHSLRFNGVSPDPTLDTYKIARPVANGGGTSELLFFDCEFQGFGHGSFLPREHKDLGGIGNNTFTKPHSHIEISGNELTEIRFIECALVGYETVAMHVHDARHITYNGSSEMHNGARFICSGPRNTNPHTIDPSIPAASETLTFHLKLKGSTLNNGLIDLRPYIRESGVNIRFTDGADNGFFTPVNLSAPEYGVKVLLDQGSALLAPTGLRAGIGRQIEVSDFFNPSMNDSVDWAFYYDDAEDDIKLLKSIIIDEDNEIQIGAKDNPLKRVFSDAFVSREVDLVNDSVFTIPTEYTGGYLMFHKLNVTETQPNVSESGIIWFDIGTGPNIQKIVNNMATSLNVVTTDVTGTTGSVGEITISATVGALKIENRDGFERRFRWTIM